MDVAARHLGENARKIFIVELFLDIITMQQKHIGDVFHDHFEQIRIINAEVADYLENVGFHKWSRAYFPGNRHKFGDEYGKMIYEYSSPYYKVESYILAYADPIYPVPAEEFWNLPLEILDRVIPPPEKKTKSGRKRLKRVPTIGEVVSKKRNKCSLCKRFGHKKTSCPTRSNEVVGTSNGVVS
ncbi:hypothetical protein H5410_035994 [Solanum commersonii]|uniref:Uncharacterized protein n=1 Tax=Solanum commersonii TaxID=4109 RepID=A0A9J5Y454_SOLCO|nr:hypothetical protein H5410_035994 [Solanum commersonii]